MIDEVYGITKISTLDNESVVVPVTIKDETSFSDCDITMTILNEINNCIVISNIPVTSKQNVLSSELIGKIPSNCIIRYIIKLSANGMVLSIDETKLKIDRRGI